MKELIQIGPLNTYTYAKCLIVTPSKCTKQMLLRYDQIVAFSCTHGELPGSAFPSFCHACKSPEPRCLEHSFYITTFRYRFTWIWLVYCRALYDCSQTSFTRAFTVGTPCISADAACISASLFSQTILRTYNFDSCDVGLWSGLHVLLQLAVWDRYARVLFTVGTKLRNVWTWRLANR